MVKLVLGLVFIITLYVLKIYLKPDKDNVKEHTIQTIDEKGEVHIKTMKREKIDKEKLRRLKRKVFWWKNKKGSRQN